MRCDSDSMLSNKQVKATVDVKGGDDNALIANIRVLIEK